MSMTESATEQNLANDLESSPEESEIQAGNPLPIGGAHEQGGGSILFCSAVTQPVFAWGLPTFWRFFSCEDH
jgi:hypothetical protein